jgi:hypothetical protein
MANPSELPHGITDWITAVSTAITALAAVLASIIGFVEYKRGGRVPLPLIEPTFSWVDPKDGHFLQLHIVIRNQLSETIIFEHMKIRKPRGMTFALLKRESSHYLGPMGKKRSINFVRTDFPHQPLNWQLSPIGEESAAFRGSQHEMTWRLDVHVEDLYFSPPRSWNGGEIAIELILLSKALTIRPRRFTIKRRVGAPPGTQADLKTENTPEV